MIGTLNHKLQLSGNVKTYFLPSISYQSQFVAIAKTHFCHTNILKIRYGKALGL